VLTPLPATQATVYKHNKSQYSLRYRNCKKTADLNIRFISWMPSPLRKRSRLAGSISAEQRLLNKFSINSTSSTDVASWRLYIYSGNITHQQQLLRRQVIWKYWQQQEVLWFVVLVHLYTNEYILSMATWKTGLRIKLEINCIFGYGGPKHVCYFHNCRWTEHHGRS